MIRYLRTRLNERSFWIAMGAGVTAASALTHPWGAIFLTTAVVAALVPDGPVKK